MPAKKDLAAMLKGESPKPALRRGQGMRLSTETAPAETPQIEAERTSAQTQDRTNAITHNRTNAVEEPKRINRGYKLREDLIKACKRIALDEDRHLYEVMETALEEYISRRTT